MKISNLFIYPDDNKRCEIKLEGKPSVSLACLEVKVQVRFMGKCCPAWNKRVLNRILQKVL